jgi:hypothetical protein
VSTPKRALLVLVLGSCAKPSAPVPTPVAIASASASQPATLDASTVPPLAATRHSRDDYPAAIEPESQGCVLAGKWEHDQPRALSFAPGGKPFATFPMSTDATLQLYARAGGGRAAYAELSSDAVKAFGFVDDASLSLHASHGIVLSAWVVPGPRAPLRWTSATRDHLSVEAKAPPTVQAAGAIGADCVCTDLAIGEVSFDPRAAIGATKTDDASFKAVKGIPLSVEADAAPVAHLEFDAGSQRVEVIARQGPLARVLFHPGGLDPAQDMLFFGWVPASALSTQSTGSGGSWGTGGQHGVNGPPPKARVVCDGEVPLVAELDGETHLVGAVLPHVPLDVGDALSGPGEDLVDARPHGGAIGPAEGARLRAKRSVLASCAVVP